MQTQEISHARLRPVEHSADILVPCRPGVFQKGTSVQFVIGGKAIPQPIKSFSQRGPPLLVPARSASCVAAAITLPSVHSVRATPGSHFLNSNFFSGRMQREVLAIIRQPREFVFLNILQSKSQGHVAVWMVMSIGFAISRNMHELRRITFRIEMAQQPTREILTAVQQLLECHRSCDRAIVEEQSDGPPRRQNARIWMSRICPVFEIYPWRILINAKLSRLSWSQDRKLDALGRENLQSFRIHRRFRQPYPLGIACKA